MSADSYHHGDLRRALLDEATLVLEAEGVDGLSLRGLARRLGVSHAAPGHHFGTKAVLLAELAADGYAALADAMDVAMAELEPARWPVGAGQAYVRFALANPERYRLIFGTRMMTAEEMPERLGEEAGRAYAGLRRAVRGYEASGDTDLVDPTDEAELATWGVVHGAVMLWLDGQLGTVETEADFLALIDRVVLDFCAGVNGPVGPS